MVLDVKQLGALIAPVAQLVHAGSPEKIKGAIDRLIAAVSAEIPGGINPPSWEEIAVHAQKVIDEADTIIDEINK